MKLAAPAVEHVRTSLLRVDPNFAKLLPPPNNLDGLRASIGDRGVLVPLLIARNGLVLDGHSRLGVARELGLATVPVLRLDLEGGDWKRVVALATNLHRRHLHEAQRVALGTSLERIERAHAAKRRLEGNRAGGRARARGRGEVAPHGEGRAHDRHERETAARVAKQVGVSRLTYERASAVIRRAPAEVVNRMLHGDLSVAGAHAELRRRDVVARSRRERRRHEPGLWRGELGEVPGGVYRTIYIDPPWLYADASHAGSPEYPTMSVEELEALDVARLAHPHGAHCWTWLTWPLIRDGIPHRVLEAWGFRWVGEVVWSKGYGTTGHWVRSTTEVCALAVRGSLPLMESAVSGLISAERQGHSVKPGTMRSLIERVSPAPRIELFGRSVPKGWDGWGLEARRTKP